MVIYYVITGLGIANKLLELVDLFDFCDLENVQHFMADQDFHYSYCNRPLRTQRQILSINVPDF